MQDDKFDEWLQHAAASYNAPPAPDVERMWADIEAKHFGQVTTVTRRAPAPWWSSGLMKMAAALLIGVGLGRVSSSPRSVDHTTATRATPAVAVASDSVGVQPIDEPAASRYLGQTVALLATLQSDARASTSDAVFRKRATDLLLTTRLLLDSPSARNPKVLALLDDLELVLAQIVQMPAGRNAADLDLIHQAMEQRDVMPRLRTAVANTYSAE
jgi:hypothetical protein